MSLPHWQLSSLDLWLGACRRVRVREMRMRFGGGREEWSNVYGRAWSTFLGIELVELVGVSLRIN